MFVMDILFVMEREQSMTGMENPLYIQECLGMDNDMEKGLYT